MAENSLLITVRHKETKTVKQAYRSSLKQLEDAGYELVAEEKKAEKAPKSAGAATGE